MFKAAIFDLDGTLTDTLSSISYFANKALEKYGLNSIEKEKYKIMVGNGAKKLVRRMLAENNCDDEEVYQKVLIEYNTTYDNDFTYLTVVYDGIFELIDYLKENGFKLGVVSNKPHSTTVQIVDHFFPQGTFDRVYGQRENVAIKPDPTAVFEELEEFCVRPDECIYVGDTGTDMKTGRNTNAFTVGVTWGFRDEKELLENGADFIANHPSDIIKYLKKS